MPNPAIQAALPPVWKMMPAQWVVLGSAGAAVLFTFYSGLTFMVSHWDQVPEYSYGYFVPLISLFLLWQRSDRLRELELQGSWSGLWLVAMALALGVVGDFSSIRVFSQYGFVVALFGLSVCAIGWRGTKVIAMPLAILLFMIPLPQFLLRELSQQLQLVSSELGVWLIRQVGISVFLEGNVIDLGSYKLQVVEACSGLRYLFPLMVLGVLAAYFFQGAWWKRVVIVVSTVPLTIGINSLRIAIIGVTVEYFGSSMAEGLLHDFEGFFMFMLCMLLLVAEMALLARIGKSSGSLRSVFGLEYPDPVPHGSKVRYRRLSIPAVAGALLIGAVALLLHWGPSREPVVPKRQPFAEFPMSLSGGWSGKADRLASDIVATLAVDDYLIANYRRGNEPWVNFYSAWYNSQSGGQSTHSPRTCIPGGGWTITDLAETRLPLTSARAVGSGEPATSLAVNRAIIQTGEQRQLVYYWFDQRGRVLTNEFAVKWYILQDALQAGRSDGALVRLVTPILPQEDITKADRRLLDLLSAIHPFLHEHVPN